MHGMLSVPRGTALPGSHTRRALGTRLHSAGHLLDSALKNIGALQRLNLTPSKGYHFPAGPYVGTHAPHPVAPAEQRDSP